MAQPVTAAPARQPAPAAPPRHSAFRQFLSELNPLQYLPVIGTLYRAATHDTIPETAREAGSLVVSFLTGGPIGAAINLGSLAVEKATGIDPEKLGQQVLASIGIGGGPAKPTVSVAENAVIQTAPPSASPTTPSPKPASAPHQGWSASQLAAYGVTRTANNELKRGNLSGADVLNDLELAKQKPVSVA